MDRPAVGLTALREKGIQHLRGFFPLEMREEFALRAAEIVAGREDGCLSIVDQETRGLPGDWYQPLIENPEIIQLVTSFLGEDVCSIGFRILTKDKHFKGAVAIHQDWPYNPGDTKKLTLFIPLTPVSRANGGLIFFEESHLYGPQSRGSLDPSRFDPMEEVCPTAEVGDLLLCDFLTWHYSQPPEPGNEQERIMVQINYQPASDASGTQLVAGRFPHNRRHALPSRFEAASNPSTDVNLPFARKFLAQGDAERAIRYAKGLLYDDPEHAGAALFLSEILAESHDPAALIYLEQARTALRKMCATVSDMDSNLGLAVEPDHPTIVSAVHGKEEWRALALPFFSQVAAVPNSDTMPAILSTPEEAWGYGAISELISPPGAAAMRIRARSLRGRVGLCLISEDCRTLLSPQHLLTQESPEETIVLVLKGPSRVLVRNFDDPGRIGEVEILSVAVRDYPAD